MYCGGAAADQRGRPAAHTAPSRCLGAVEGWAMMVSEAQEERTVEAVAMTVKHASAYVTAGEAHSIRVKLGGARRVTDVLYDLCEAP